MSPDFAVSIVWLVWYVPWIAAVVWSAKTTTQMGTDIQGAHRLLSGLGVMLLFFVPATSGGTLFGSALLGLFATKLWHEPDWAAWSLVALTVVAFGFCWWARLHLGRLWSGFVTLKEGHRVIDTGPYALVRHPIYSGVILAAIGSAVVIDKWRCVVGVGLVVIGYCLKAGREEAMLSRQFGDAFEEHRRHTGFLIPRFR